MVRTLRSSLLRLALAILALAASTVRAEDAKPPVDPVLFQTIKDLDARVFAAFNAADLEATKQFFTPDLEFYHDKDGLSDYAQFVKAIDRLYHQAVRPQRTLLPETLEVYPIKDYGAVQIGEHRFCVVENGKTSCSVFKFVHVWRYRDGQWKIARVMSFGH